MIISTRVVIKGSFIIPLSAKKKFWKEIYQNINNDYL
jgi:hypothetical protein